MKWRIFRSEVDPHEGFSGQLVAAAARSPYADAWKNSDRRHFAEWPCPRCHSVWPGTKTEKDSSCKICGLRLHQMML